MSEPSAVPTERGPWQWVVTWGVWLRLGSHSIVVEAFDADEALVLAHERQPKLARPRTAFLARRGP
jgi:hypothetical protein